MVNYNLPNLEEIDYSETPFDGPTDLVGKICDEKPLIGRITQFHSQYTSLVEEINMLEEEIDENPTQYIDIDEPERDDLVQIPEDQSPDHDVTEHSFEHSLEYVVEGYEGNVLRYIENGNIDTDQLMEDVNRLRDNGRYDDFLGDLYDDIIVTNQLRNAVRDEVSDQSGDEEPSADTRCPEGLYELLENYADRREDLDLHTEHGDEFEEGQEILRDNGY
jgi:hypothetical protein